MRNAQRYNLSNEKRFSIQSSQCTWSKKKVILNIFTNNASRIDKTDKPCENHKQRQSITPDIQLEVAQLGEQELHCTFNILLEGCLALLRHKWSQSLQILLNVCHEPLLVICRLLLVTKTVPKVQYCPASHHSQKETRKHLKTITVRIKTLFKWRPKPAVWKCQQCQQL